MKNKIKILMFFLGFPDQGYEESDHSSVFSTPSPKSRQRQQPTSPLVTLETQHASLKRKKVRRGTDKALQFSKLPTVSNIVFLFYLFLLFIIF